MNINDRKKNVKYFFGVENYVTRNSCHSQMHRLGPEKVNLKNKIAVSV